LEDLHQRNAGFHLCSLLFHNDPNFREEFGDHRRQVGGEELRGFHGVDAFLLAGVEDTFGLIVRVEVELAANRSGERGGGEFLSDWAVFDTNVFHCDELYGL